MNYAITPGEAFGSLVEESRLALERLRGLATTALRPLISSTREHILQSDTAAQSNEYMGIAYAETPEPKNKEKDTQNPKVTVIPAEDPEKVKARDGILKEQIQKRGTGAYSPGSTAQTSGRKTSTNAPKISGEKKK